MGLSWAEVRWLGLGLVVCAACSAQPTSQNGGARANAPRDEAAASGGRSSVGGAAGAGAAPDSGPGALVPTGESLAPDGGFCTGQAVSVRDLASGNVRAGAMVLLPKLVASSQKFLVSASKTSGKCWWGAFATDEGASGENSGVLLLSSADASGAVVDGGAPVCAPGADSLPPDLTPGDRIAAFGSFSDYAPAACPGTAPMRELLLKPGCALERSERGAAPTPVPLTPDLADRLAQGRDAALLRAWSGALVELRNLNALAVSGSASAVGPFGVIAFQETRLELHSKVPYADLSAGGPHQPEKALVFSYPAHFDRADGVLFLDYCTWSLEIRDSCLDLSPQSGGCLAPGG